ncbi:tripartite tricarboxylate transporter permease [Neorhizobium sp. T786]|uniref:tripartite tricarboxylate transporter permease n=1 Tax=Pseudorhizobium xiangyangii TaxID=2883104 RepID=UPI001CFFD803|nr:tripartite tricarboxylate transporter permease [Neorhizobium xiangyangii]MCB5201174.1 tripartite tricarboxylate transporter permease [Neorhizobium xiangyangii]
MWDTGISGLLGGLLVAVEPINLFICFIGVVLGTLVGVLPGVGPVVTISLLLPLTFGMEPVTALIMLAGIYYGAQYGGSTTAILLKLPGETAAVLTCLDGNQLARNGRAGAALGMSAISSFVAGTIGTLAVVFFAPLLVSIALDFGPAENVSLMLLGLTAAVMVAQGPSLPAVGMLVAGILLGTIGTDTSTGIARYHFGIPELRDGVNFVVIAMGIYGFGEIIANLEEGLKQEKLPTARITNIYPTRDDFRRSWKAILRGSFIGSAVGFLPGLGTSAGAFAAYTVEKKVSAHPELFGTGVIEGVAAPEAANNAAAQTNFIPLLTLGLPSGAIMALMAGAMMIHGVVPGPAVMTTRPELFWGLIASMFVGNLMLLFLNLNLIRVWVKVLTIPYSILFPVIMLLCAIGIYSLNNSTFDILLAAFFGLVGYIFIKLKLEPAPLLMGFVLGPMLEENFRRTMTIARGDLTIFISKPISAGLLAATALTIFFSLVLPRLRRTRHRANFTNPKIEKTNA